jgi:hypothetical protein
VAIDSLNRIVVLQTDLDAVPNVTRISRFLPNGSADMFFGVSGSLDLASGIDNVEAGAVTVDGADNIYVAGTVHDATLGAVAHVYVAKVNSSGALDPSFAGTGFHVLSLESGPSEDSTAWGIALDPSSRIVITGASVDLGASVGLLNVMRVTPAGDLDTSFGGGAGFVRTDTMALDPPSAYVSRQSRDHRRFGKHRHCRYGDGIHHI